MPIPSSRAIARAKTATRKRRSKKDKDDLLSKLVNSFKQPTDGIDGVKGKDGRDAPTLEDILSKVAPMLPEPRIEVTEKTIVEKLDAGELEDIVEAMLAAKIPEISKELRPKVELIREEVDIDLEGFVSKEDFDKALIRIQDAITYHSGSRGKPSLIELSQNIVIVDSDYIAIPTDGVIECINTSPITVTLPDVTSGEIITIKRRDDEVTVLGLIDGVQDKIINVQRWAMKLIYNGTEWFAI